MGGRLVFVTGGARSGKSRYAEGLAASFGGPVLYVATAEARDEEMERRIADHRRRRPEGWRTLEARLGVGDRLREEFRGEGTVLLDCLSLLVSNVLLDAVEVHGEEADSEPVAREVEAELDSLLGWWEEVSADLVVVSNEVGWGVVPPHRLGRAYRDLLGTANQRVAARATDAFLLVAGMPVTLKEAGR